jgi:uncharacterized Zn-finger protein
MGNKVNANTKPLESNAVKRDEGTNKELPLHCPMANMTLWNSHPRVYLPIEESGEAACPYWGAVYILKE